MAQHGWQDDVRNLFDEAREEAQRAITYVNDRIVPEVRRATLRLSHEGAALLRGTADRLDGRRGVTGESAK